MSEIVPSGKGCHGETVPGAFDMEKASSLTQKEGCACVVPENRSKPTRATPTAPYLNRFPARDILINPVNPVLIKMQS